MTQPPDPQMQAMQDTLKTVQETLKTVQVTLEKLTRAVDGDSGLGMPSVRAEATALKVRVEAIELENRDQKNRIKGMMTLVAWAGGSSLITILALIAALTKFFGGHT